MLCGRGRRKGGDRNLLARLPRTIRHGRPTNMKLSQLYAVTLVTLVSGALPAFGQSSLRFHVRPSTQPEQSHPVEVVAPSKPSQDLPSATAATRGPTARSYIWDLPKTIGHSTSPAPAIRTEHTAQTVTHLAPEPASATPPPPRPLLSRRTRPNLPFSAEQQDAGIVTAPATPHEFRAAAHQAMPKQSIIAPSSDREPQILAAIEEEPPYYEEVAPPITFGALPGYRSIQTLNVPCPRKKCQGNPWAEYCDEPVTFHDKWRCLIWGQPSCDCCQQSTCGPASAPELAAPSYSTVPYSTAPYSPAPDHPAPAGTAPQLPRNPLPPEARSSSRQAPLGSR